MIKSKITLFCSIAVFMAVMGFSGLAFAADVIIDNGDPGTTPTGAWLTSSGPNPFDGSSLYSNEIGAFYTYEASVNGIQQVSLWWTFFSNRCTSVQVDINDGTTLLDTVTVNQLQNGGQWNLLGTYTFSGTARVVINSQGGCTTCADAVKFSTPAQPPQPQQPVEDLHSWSQILPASERFELVMGGAGVLDKETALVWEQSPAVTSVTWFTALTHCFTKKTDGRGGWRMPTIEELHSLVDSTQSDPPLPNGHPFSTNVLTSSYWSSTTIAGPTPVARTVVFSSGFVFSSNKANPEHVWCVRGGQGHDAY